jgi:diaminohydroxyphosphoribosylaminopyrimidine deaminase/5-amino-6-(5-phosphoribosylamino)uracil reductase
MTLDGKIASRTGDSRWISNEAARRRVHLLRGRMDGIVVGIGTVLADNPRLTARPPGPRAAARVVLDSRGRLPDNSLLARSAREAAVLVVTAEAPSARVELLRNLGCELLNVSPGNGGICVPQLLEELGRRRWSNLLVEGGSAVLGSFLDARAMDEIHVFLSPRLLGGAAALSATGGRGAERIAQALTLTDYEVEDLEGDLLIHGRVPMASSP